MKKVLLKMMENEVFFNFAEYSSFFSVIFQLTSFCFSVIFYIWTSKRIDVYNTTNNNMRLMR